MKDVYETDMHKIYNLIVGHTNEMLQETAASYANLKVFKLVQDPIEYLIILKKILFSNQSEQNPIRSMWLKIRRLYNTMHHFNQNNNKYLFRFPNSQKVNKASNGSLITRAFQ